ncbi:MAG TPA: hypothetical protein VFB19_10520 [Mycobacterium sp.]|nr:hypothetical protein [Mycobacterium sp.]
MIRPLLAGRRVAGSDELPPLPPFKRILDDGPAWPCGGPSSAARAMVWTHGY